MDQEIIREAASLYERIRNFRRRLHTRPELSFVERETVRIIASELDKAGIAYRPIAQTGLLARIEGRGDLSRAVVLRADIDALPVTEQTDVEFASQNKGVMHACGHDMHAAALLGALLLLNERRTSFEGTVFGLFQPGEEKNPGGASLVLAEHPFDRYHIEAFIGEHIEPELPTGVFGFHPGQYMASSDELYFTVHGVGGHGAIRKNLKDPIPAAAELITALHTLPAERPDPDSPTVISIGRVIAEGATNVVPNDVSMAGTLRVFNEAWRAEAKRRIRAKAEAVDARHGTHTEINISHGYPSVVNDPALTERAMALTQQLFGEQSVVSLDIRPTAEDFGFYTTRYPSLFFRCGVGQEALLEADRADRAAGKLHTPLLCPNESALRYAPALLASLALQTLE